MASPTLKALHALASLLQRRSFSYVDEKVCQQEIHAFLESKGVPVVREHDFGIGVGVCDFFLPRSGLVIEVKAHKSWAKRAVYRQCERYCRMSEVKGLLLATGKAQGLPSTIAGKPALVYQLGLGAL